jgi:hypothetical protein
MKSRQLPTYDQMQFGQKKAISSEMNVNQSSNLSLTVLGKSSSDYITSRVAVQGHGSNLEQWASWFKCETVTF